MTRGILIMLGGLWLAAGGQARDDGRLRYAADEVAARRVHAMLDRDTWAQVVRIANAAPSRTRPPVAWATVFRLRDRLWIYLPREGTGSLSVYRGRLARDQADLSGVLRLHDAGFAGHAVVVDDETAAESILFGDTPADLRAVPNTCFVRSAARFLHLARSGAAVAEAHLLLFYGGTGPSRWGHTVLCYRTPQGWFYWDPDAPERAREIPGGATADDLARARRVSPGVPRAQIAEARRFELVATG